MVDYAKQNVFSEVEWKGIVKQLSIPHRQSEVLKRLICGHSDKQIANDMGIALSTVRTYLQRLFARFEVQDRHELVISVFAYFRWQCKKIQKCPMEDFYRSIGITANKKIQSRETIT